ncbi:MAG: hypothetical protein WDW38_009354 [Sanguina aurantia]
METATAVKGRKAVAIGYSARKLWSELPAGKRTDGSHFYLTGAGIKLALHSPSEAQPMPAGVTPVMAAADFLSMVRRNVMMHLGGAVADALGVRMHPDMLKWCVTVPAQWGEASKAAVRTAALRAGIITKVDSPQLMIVLEPEAAALHAKVFKSLNMSAGNVFMVVDAGGGTVDVTVHEVEEEAGEVLLAEVVSADGDFSGSTFVDRNFEAFYRHEVGHTYGNSSSGSGPGNSSSGSGPGNSSSSCSSSKTAEAKVLCSKLLLVGGFADSPYLQARIREAFLPRGVEVVVPHRPYAAVLSGAVLYGSHPELIRARRSRLSYGLRACAPYIDGAPGKFWHEAEKCFYTDRIFNAFVSKNERVGSNQEFSHYFTPLYPEQDSCIIELYGGDAVDVPYVDDDSPNSMHKIAELTIQSPPAESVVDDDDLPPLERLIHVGLLFGGTQIGVVAEDCSSGTVQRTRVKFASY